MKKPKIYYHLHDIKLGYIPEGKENWTCKDDLRDLLADQLATGSDEPEKFEKMSLDELCIYAGYKLESTVHQIK